MKDRKQFILIILAVFIFWIIDLVTHISGVGESEFYFISKFVNAVLFSTIWFYVFNSKEHWKKLIFSFVFGTWISIYYLFSSYSGVVQTLGVTARYTPPPFVIGGISFTPYLWWIFHIIVFYIALELASNIMRGKN